MENICKRLGVRIPVIHLPREGVDLSKWAVVACDQYTSQPEYWKQVDKYVGDEPSTLRMVFPEVYLEDEGAEKRIKTINEAMKRYLDESILVSQDPGFILIDRQTSHSASRKGLIMALDLEKYDYHKGSQSLIRATEGTIVDRLPPRIKVREKACIELPHIMVLINDPEKTVIEPLAEKAAELEKLYDFDLMMSSGHIKGYRVADPGLLQSVLEALERLAHPETFQEQGSLQDEKDSLLFAVGDGNHSLATAKECWEAIKSSLTAEEAENHPARYALVELVNVHDAGLNFEPIHRVLFQANPTRMLDQMVNFYQAQGSESQYHLFDTEEQMVDELQKAMNTDHSHIFSFVMEEKYGLVVVKNPEYNLVVGTLQSFLDHYLSSHLEARIDYIHGREVVHKLGSQKGNIGFYLPAMDKNDLFKTVILDGVLPRKTFSMGEADEKRFYLECRKISC